MIARYINSNNEVLEFHTKSVWMVDQGFHTRKWRFEDNKVENDITEVQCTLQLRGTASERAELLNNISKLFEYDLMNNAKGRLYIGDYYYECYPISSQVAVSNGYCARNDLTLSFYGSGYWINPQSFTFLKVEQIEVSKGKTYPYTYDYTYTENTYTHQTITNQALNDSDFKIVIYGVVENPQVQIMGHLYNINTFVEANEYLVIQCINNVKSTYKVKSDGTIINCFNSRNKEVSPFKKIPSGQVDIDWSGTFGFDLTIYEKRSEPKWM